MIARYVGLGSAAYFHRLFMREMQVSPMQYRKLHKITQPVVYQRHSREGGNPVV
jgi:AraC-like DNA-binding protein